MSTIIPSLSDQMLEIMYQALGEPIGLLCQTNDFNRARSTFSAAKKKAQDPALDQLEFRGSPLKGGDFIIIKGQPVATAQLQDLGL